MLHWLEVSRPLPPIRRAKLKVGDAKCAETDGKFPDIKATSKARREWNSRLPIDPSGR